MTKGRRTNWQGPVVAAAGIVLSTLFGSIVLAETAEPIISSTLEGAENVTVRDVTVKDGIVSGVVVNNTGHELGNVELLIRYDWLWNNEFSPGEDNPGRAVVHRVQAVAPAGEIPFSYQPESRLPERSDGHFVTSVKVVGYTEFRSRRHGEPKAKSSKIDVKCGNVIEREFTRPTDQHEYHINMSPGDALEIAAKPVGDFLFLSMDIYEPGGSMIYNIDPTGRPRTSSVSIATGVLSGRGTYRIMLYNHSGRVERGTAQPGRLGVYRVFIGCRLHDGTVIKPETTLERTAK